jgi:hypothetical protein
MRPIAAPALAALFASSLSPDKFPRALPITAPLIAPESGPPLSLAVETLGAVKPRIKAVIKMNLPIVFIVGVK